VSAASVLPYSWVQVNTGEPIVEEDLVEFRLLYQGELLPSGNSNTRPAEKHRVRRYLHPQLRRQWDLHSGLRQLAVLADKFPKPGATEAERVAVGIAAIGKQWTKVGYDFVPMVTTKDAIRCSLDILLLRPDEERFVFTQGDIDGQIKTLFDALNLPRSLEQVGGMAPQDDETPFFCLLEDDRLISEVRVNSDQLLLLPGERQVKANDAFAVIHVKLNYKGPRFWDRYLD